MKSNNLDAGKLKTDNSENKSVGGLSNDMLPPENYSIVPDTDLK